MFGSDTKQVVILMVDREGKFAEFTKEMNLTNTVKFGTPPGDYYKDHLR